MTLFGAREKESVPWKACASMELRLQFVMRLKSGERMAELCREFGVSRKTGYKILGRYEELGAAGLGDQSRAPKSSKVRVPEEIAARVIAARKAHPGWGGRKLKAVLERQAPEVRWPAPSKIGTLLKRANLVDPRKRRDSVSRYPNRLVTATAPNDLWCTDFKGQFRLGDGKYCYPLTITDRFSRKIIACDGLERIDLDATIESFTLAFREHGLPEMIRSDNGAPFASRGLWGLTRLSVWWWRLGIQHERTEPASPQQNGQHERMHRDLKRETARPSSKNMLAQQERFNEFVDEYNRVRPHEALGLKTPSELYKTSSRPMPARLLHPEYPLHDDIVEVSHGGHIRLGRSQLFISSALVGQRLGIRECDDGSWVITFVDRDLGTWQPKLGFSALGAAPLAAPSAS